ncbi:hypothetical protein O6203_23720, partial [Salmonella enterica subsp. enterica]
MKEFEIAGRNISPAHQRHLEGLVETVKDIEKRLGQPDVVLESFIVSNTPSHEMSKLWGITKGEMQKRLFGKSS